MKKKFLSVMLASVMAMSMIGCGSSAVSGVAEQTPEQKDFNDRFMMGESPYGEQMTVAVTNAMVDSYGITADQLHEDAITAMKMNQPYSIRPLVPM